jgi:hypothetical protein
MDQNIYSEHTPCTVRKAASFVCYIALRTPRSSEDMGSMNNSVGDGSAGTYREVIVPTTWEDRFHLNCVYFKALV